MSSATSSAATSRYRRTVERWCASPVRLGISCGAAGVCFAVLRLAVAGRGNVASFIVAGSSDVRRSRLPPGIPVVQGRGYDGEFYYRLALNPLDWGHSAFGIDLDTVYRIDRIGYPALAWLVAGGHASYVPAALVAVNVAALGALGGFGAALARTAGRQPMWGLALAGYWGLLWSLGRDLTEVVTAAAIVGGLLALRRDRPLLAAAALTVAVLSRESALVLVAALGLARLLQWARSAAGASPPRRALCPRSGRSGPSTLDLAWVVPLLAFVAWEGAVDARTGRLPLTASQASNVGAPFVGFARGFAHYLHLLPAGAALLWFAELTLLVLVGAMAAMSYRGSEAFLHERLAWLGYGLLTIALAPSIWLGDVGFRSLVEFYLFSWLLLLCSRRRLGVPAGLLAVAWLVVCMELVVNI